MRNKTLWLVVLGLLLRLGLIFPGPFESKVEFFTNKADLRNYYWPAQAALKGENPYDLWSSGASGEFRADMAPLELLVYVATVAVWNDPRAIQVLFAIFDAVNIALLGLVLRPSPLKRPFQIFYAFGPLTVYNLVLVPEDKTIVLTLSLMISYLLTLQQDRPLRLGRWSASPGLLAIGAAAFLASFKWLSVFYLLPLLLFVARDARRFVGFGALFAVIVGLTHLAWFPSWMYVYVFRLGRVPTPIHISPAVLLNSLGLFDRVALLGVLAASLLLIYALFWSRRIDIFETVALSVAAGILWTPDMDPVHLAIVVFHLLLIVNWTGRIRLLLVWALSAWVSLVYALSTRTGFTHYGLPDLRVLTGIYGTPQMIVLSYVLFLAVLAFYLIDKWRGQPTGGAVLVGAQVASIGRYANA